MSVYPLPLNVVVSLWQSNGTVVYPIPNVDVAILAGKKFLLDGPAGTSFIKIDPVTHAMNFYVSGSQNRINLSLPAGGGQINKRPNYGPFTGQAWNDLSQPAFYAGSSLPAQAYAYYGQIISESGVGNESIVGIEGQSVVSVGCKVAESIGVIGTSLLTSNTGIPLENTAQGVLGRVYSFGVVADPSKPSRVAGVEGLYLTTQQLTSGFSLSATKFRAALVGHVFGNPDSIPHAAVLSFLGESWGPMNRVIPAAFKAVCVQSLGGGFNYGLDLKNELSFNIVLADIRGHAGNTLKNLSAGTWEADTAIKANGLTLGIVTKAFADTGYIASVADYTILGDAVGGAVVLNLPTAVGISGKIYNFKKVDATGNAVTVTPNGAETIDGAPNKALAVQWASVTLQSDGANWLIL